VSSTRYAQQIAVDQVGEEGQQRLTAARVLVIGAGGLGTPVATTLAAVGIGTLTLVDGDRIEATNLHRQFHYHPADIGAQKATTLAARLKGQNPEISIRAIDQHLDAANAAQLIAEHDVVCDCTDNLEARILIDRVCGELGKPLVFAAVREWEGYLTVLHHAQRFHLREAFDMQAYYADQVLNCAVAGIVPTTCNVLGNLQANEAIKVVLGLPTTLDSGLLCVDLRRMVFRTFVLQRGLR